MVKSDNQSDNPSPWNMKDPWDLCSRNPHWELVCLNLSLSLKDSNTNRKVTTEMVSKLIVCSSSLEASIICRKEIWTTTYHVWLNKIQASEYCNIAIQTRYWILDAPDSFIVSFKRLILSFCSSHAIILPFLFIRAARWTVLFPGAAHASRTLKYI